MSPIDTTPPVPVCLLRAHQVFDMDRRCRGIRAGWRNLREDEVELPWVKEEIRKLTSLQTGWVISVSLRCDKSYHEWSCPYGDLDDADADVLYEHLQLYHTEDMRRKAGLILCCPRVKLTRQQMTFLWNWTAFLPLLYNTTVPPSEYISGVEDHKPRPRQKPAPALEPAVLEQTIQMPTVLEPTILEPPIQKPTVPEPTAEEIEQATQHDMCATFIQAIRSMGVSEFQTEMTLEGFFPLAGKKRKYQFCVITV